MLKIHRKIIKEVLEEKKNPKVVAILLYGSLARGTANRNSDVDIEIIYDNGKYRSWSEKRSGIKVDFEVWPRKKLQSRIEKYPYLSYPYLEEKILYDQHGFAKNIKQILKKYFKEHPDALKSWKKWLKEYPRLKKTLKNDREKAESCRRFYDQLEIRFSKNHRVTRKFR